MMVPNFYLFLQSGTQSVKSPFRLFVAQMVFMYDPVHTVVPMLQRISFVWLYKRTLRPKTNCGTHNICASELALSHTRTPTRACALILNIH